MAFIPENVVWILGSGFSRPLGGPLLKELLHPNAAEDAIARHHPSEVSGVFLRGGPYAVSNSIGLMPFPGAPLWSDAEVFLEELDLACNNPKSMAHVKLIRVLSQAGILTNNKDKQLIMATLCRLRSGALRLIALQCQMFTEFADVTSENWSPYTAWAADVKGRPGHSFVTFNYDLVPNRLGLSCADASDHRDFEQVQRAEVARERRPVRDSKYDEIEASQCALERSIGKDKRGRRDNLHGL